MKFQFDPLPKGFVSGKPIDQKDYDEKEVHELERQGRLIITRKRDGWKIYAVFYKGKVKLYTAGGNEIDSRLDHIKSELKLLRIPEPALIPGEGVLSRDRDDIGKVGGIFRASLKKSLQLQEKYGKIHFMPFGIIFYGGKPVINEPFWKNLELIQKIFGKARRPFKYLFPVEVIDATYDETKRMVEEKGWEGLVLYDRDFVNEFRLDGGDPKRPTGCYKKKPVVEDDFIVREVIWSEKRPGQIKEVVLAQIDPKTGREFNCGKFGLFTKKAREEIKNARLPFVIQIKFGSRYPSGKIRDGKEFLRIRDDKRLEECLAPQKANPTE